MPISENIGRYIEITIPPMVTLGALPMTRQRLLEDVMEVMDVMDVTV